MKSLNEQILGLKRKSVEIGLMALKMMGKAGFAHIGGAMSVVDLMVALYYGEFNGNRFLKFDPKNAGWSERDYVIMSKPYAVAVWYAILADLGFIDRDELNYFSVLNSHLQGYANTKVLGVPLNMGTLGNGLGMGVGLALALKMDKAKNKVVSICGDAEMCQGEIWESVMIAGHHKLDNLVLFVDKNGIQSDGIVRNNMIMEPLAEKFEDFGWRVVQIRNGHDFNDLVPNIDRALNESRHPTAVICKTIKGKTVPFAEGKGLYHSQALSAEEMMEIDDVYEKLIDKLANPKI